MNGRKYQDHAIEWSSKDGGWVRARTDNSYCYLYARCPYSSSATASGEIIIKTQKELRNG